MIVLTLVLWNTPAFSENIDPDNNDSQFARSENGGWLNMEPQGNGGPGVEVGDSELTGYIWAENVGWINLSCKNRGTCNANDYTG